MEISSKIVKSARCLGTNTIGCQEYKAFAHISILTDSNNEEIIDLYFENKESLQFFYDEIYKTLSRS